MKLALHRSITFWSGLLVMAFVCWAWRDSMRNVSVYSRGDSLISSYRGGIFGAGDGGPPGAHRMADPVPLTYKFLQRPCWLGGEGQAADGSMADPRTMIAVDDYLRSRLRAEPAEEWAFFIPYWLILLAVAAIWLLLLFMRARRRNKITQ